MIPFPLCLKYSEEPQREPAAWFVPGSTASDWLAELTIWKVPLDSLTLYGVPKANDDLRPRGVLAVPRGARPERVSRAIPYGLFADRLYLPVHARIEPYVSERELGEQLVGSVAVFHPVAGLVSFSDADAWQVWQLLDRPAEHAVDWSRAQPGVAPSPRLISVEAEVTPSVEELLAAVREDIGSEPIDHLPPDPKGSGREPGDGLADGIRRAMARAVLWATSHASRTAREPTWINALEDWARRRMRELGTSVEAIRRREIERLMNLLQNDPDEGLRFALPIGGDAYRGRANPSAHLPPREVNFNLSHLGSAGAADPWSLPQSQHEALVARYRELANREIGLNRHRRAAYIFAELLGDYHSAARALVDGKHFREAAVLFRDRLKQPLEAARCLERGGAWQEAIEIYIAALKFETAGDLLVRLERTEEAAANYRQAVSQLEVRGDVLAAASLLENKLHVAEEALDLLAAAWPISPQALGCLSARFALLGRLGRHESAAQLVTTLCGEHHEVSRVPGLVSALAAQASAYPDENVRGQAADVVRVLAGNRLAAASESEAITLLGAVRSLVPQDELLGRDTLRFQNRRPKPAPRPKKSAPRPGDRLPQIVDRVALDSHVDWRCAASAWQGFRAAGFGRRGPVVVAGSWNSGRPFVRTEWEQAAADRWTLALESGWHHPHPTLAYLIDGPALPLRRVALGDGAQPYCEIGTPSWAPDSILAAAYSETGVLWLASRSSKDHLVAAYRPDGTLVASHDAGVGVTAMVARRDRVYLAQGEQLGLIAGGKKTWFTLPDHARRMSASMPNSRIRVVVGLRGEGGVMVFDEYGPGNRPFATDMDLPEFAFTVDGTLVAMDRNQGRLFQLSQGQVMVETTFEGLGQSPLAVLRGSRPNEFAVFTARGELVLYVIPRPS